MSQLPKEIVDKIEEEAEKRALEIGYPQSNKEVFETTYWTEHNIFCDGYKQAALHYSQVIEEKDKEIESLKTMNDALTSTIEKYKNRNPF